MAEILHFEILRKHGQTNTQTNKQTHKQTNKHTNKHTNRHGHYNTSPSPYGGEVIKTAHRCCGTIKYLYIDKQIFFYQDG